MKEQLEIDFDLHDRENNQESESFLSENRKRLSDQCVKVWLLLNTGVRLTTENAIRFGIRSLPRRILDLKENGKIVESVWIKDSEGKRLYKEWFL